MGIRHSSTQFITGNYSAKSLCGLSRDFQSTSKVLLYLYDKSLVRKLCISYLFFFFFLKKDEMNICTYSHMYNKTTQFGMMDSFVRSLLIKYRTTLFSSSDHIDSENNRSWRSSGELAWPTLIFYLNK